MDIYAYISYTTEKLNMMNSSDLKTANKYRDQLNTKLQNLKTNDNKVSDIKASDIQIGMAVDIIPLNATGTIIGPIKKGDEVLVQVGNSKMNIKITNLMRAKNTAESPIQSNTKTHKIKEFKSKYTSYEINVIGLNVDEAIPIIDKYLDDCFISNMPSARIIHGKGTGKLREGIHTFLKSHPHVSSFRLGTCGEGEMGVTIVEFKK